MLYFQPLTDSAARHVYVPEPHRAMLARTYAGCGMDVTFGSAATTLTGDSEVSVTYVGGLDFGMIGVRSVGADIAVALRAARDELVRRAGTRVLYLDLRLEDPGCAAACAVAERLGFFYGGLCPYFAEGRDVLRLQLVDVPIDVNQLAVAGPFAREILDYIVADRTRVERVAGMDAV